MKKIIAMDIDGTLLNSKRILLEETKETLLKLQREGNTLLLASGRPYKGMVALAKELEMDQHHGLVVCYNGSQVRDVQTGEILYNKPLTLAEARGVLKHLENFDVIPMVADDEYFLVKNVFGGILHEVNDANIIEYESRGNGFLLKEMKDLSQIDFEPNKILVAGEPSYLKAHYLELRAPFENELSSMFTAPVYYEFTPQNVDKGTALKAVYKDKKDGVVVAFGDAENDLSMFEFADISIAMGNATDEVKEKADHVTLSNDENGIAYALNHILNQ